MLMPNVDETTLGAMHALADKYPENCLPMIGLHPTSVNEGYREQIEKIMAFMGKRTYWGIGETGIDLYRDRTYAVQQEDSFREHIRIARASGLPIVIHARNSFDELFRILDRENDGSLSGVFHAFTGNREQAERIIGYGFKIGVGGIVSFPNAGLDRVIEQMDLRHIVLETDAPYLAPVPRRGKRNEPAYLIHTAEKIARIQGIPLETVAEITTLNAVSLFNLKI